MDIYECDICGENIVDFALPYNSAVIQADAEELSEFGKHYCLNRVMRCPNLCGENIVYIRRPPGQMGARTWPISVWHQFPEGHIFKGGEAPSWPVHRCLDRGLPWWYK